MCIIKVWLSVQALTTRKISDRGAKLGTAEFLAPIFCILMPESSSSVDIFSVASISNIDNTRLIIDEVNEPIVALNK